MQDFEIVKQLGSGSFGRVLKVVKRGKSTLNEFAIKQIKMNQLNSREKENALNEIRLLASIDSPYIIKYKSAFFEQLKSVLCIVMQYADGGDLQGLIKKKIQKKHKFHEDFIWQVAYDMLRGSKVLHSHKIIHRDIKPANIFFVNGVAKLGDLNVSKVMQGRFAQTQTGTPYYTSPQIWNNKQYDYRCDIWSLGCVIYELCTLRPPFMAKDFPGLSKKVIMGIYDPIPDTYSKKLAQMIKKCLTVNIANRPTADQLLKDTVFEILEKNQDGDVELLDTIKVPRVLKLLNQKLPQDQYEPQKRVKTLKFIQPEQKNQREEKGVNVVRSMKRIGSAVSIKSSSRAKIERNMSRQKQNEVKMMPKMPMQVPLHSPQGYVKLPRIASQKNIF